jgi:hypothetical protein
MRPGDYFVVRTKGPAAWLIRLVTRSPYNHAGIIVMVGPGWTQIVEAARKGALWSRLGDYDGDDIRISSLPLTDYQRSTISTEADRCVLHNVPYGWADLLWLGLLQWPLLRRLGFLRRWVSKTDDLVCSQLVAYCYQQAGIVFNESCPQDCTPGLLAEFIEEET